jgi:hypothetical protein
MLLIAPTTATMFGHHGRVSMASKESKEKRVTKVTKVTKAIKEIRAIRVTMPNTFISVAQDMIIKQNKY